MRPFEIDWWPRRIVCEQGAVARLGALLDMLGKRRALVVCGRSIFASSAHRRVVESLGPAYAGSYNRLRMHAPVEELVDAHEQVKSLGADAIVSLGGGSAIDAGKGVCLVDAKGQDWRDCSLNGEAAQRGARQDVPALRLAHIAVPTTTGSGSEVAPTCGFRDPAMAKKLIFRDSRLIPDVAVLDPALTLETPARLTAASGMTAVARSIECLYSGRRNPINAALGLAALRMLNASLVPSVERPDDIEARAQCQVAAAMSAIAANVNVSAVHAVGHVVGGKYGLQHGIAHAILLAPAMRLLLPAIGDQQIQVDLALGGAGSSSDANAAGRDSARRIADLVARLPLPGRLSDVGVREEDLSGIAEHASHDPIMLTAAAPVSAGHILQLLREAL